MLYIFNLLYKTCRYYNCTTTNNTYVFVLAICLNADGSLLIMWTILMKQTIPLYYTTYIIYAYKYLINLDLSYGSFLS